MSIHPSSFILHPSVWAIVPVKRLWQAKQRLAAVLAPAERAGLMRQMAQHTLAVLQETPDVDRTVVISSDADVLSLAQRMGALTLDEGEAVGLNTAVTRATDFAAAQGAESILILPADLPFLCPADVQEMLPWNGGLTICGDRSHSGTNALLLPLPTSFCFCYGRDSYRQHLQEAARLGMIAHTVFIPGIQFDLDTEQDWQNYLIMNHEQVTVRNEKQLTFPL